MRAHGRGLVLLRSFPRSSLETVLDPFTLLRACVPRLPPRAAEPASPSTMLIQARKCMRTRHRHETEHSHCQPRPARGAAPGARCRGRLSRALLSGAVNCGVASRRRAAPEAGAGRVPSRRIRRGIRGFGLFLLPQSTSNCSLYSYPRTPRLRWQHTPAHVN